MSDNGEGDDKTNGGTEKPDRSPRLAPPAWLLANLRPRPAPVPRAAVVRASVALAAPLAVGLATDRTDYGALVSMGALFAILGDTADAYRMRIFNIALPQLFGAVGVTIGTLVHGQGGWLAVVVLTLVALVSGMISSIGAVASVSGLLLLINAVVGAGLRLPDPWWLAPLLLSLGGLFVLALSLLAWPLRGREPERAAVARTYRALADLLEAAGRTPADSGTYDTKRQAVTDALNHAYDLVLARRAREHGRSAGLVRLLAQLNVVIPLVEATPAVHLTAGGRPLPAAVPAAVRELADAVATGRPGGPPPELPVPGTPAERAVDTALRHATAVVREAATGGTPTPTPTGSSTASATSTATSDTDDRLGRPDALRVRARRAARAVLFSAASWRYGLRLALCIGLAQALVSLVAVPRSYWVALTVTFILKPDYGSVFSRAVLRALGTVAGLVVAAAVLSATPRGWWDVVVMLVLAGIVPAVSAKGYAFQTAAITPVILLISDTLNHEGFDLVLPRFVDSMIGCAIALVAGYLLWPESWHTRVGTRLADAVDDTAEYVRSAFAPGADQPERVRQRRRIYRELSVVRTEFQRALTEPPPTGTRAMTWWPLVVAVERIVDATTAARVRIDHGARPPAPAEVAGVERQLRELAAAVRSSRTAVRARDRAQERARVRPDPHPHPYEAEANADTDAITEAANAHTHAETDERSPLAPLRHEVGAARAIVSTTWL
ncbi:FUSC family protein [Streptomyces paludis]|uniref:FUSC family protein n=1 Tax=Streptomyces paludis TaxID=2282738 RepID=A0A345HQ19_9ACTN|nr:FUSC family protein [Streptomyces paludis]AXG78793.1 FUSC family protein [Streptomyces paludis]